MESRSKGTMILRYSGRFYKVIKVRSSGDNPYTFECKDIDTKQIWKVEAKSVWFS